MTIDGNIIMADDGKALHRIGEPTPTTITRVALAANDSAANWADCDYGETADETRYSVRSIIRELKTLGKFAAVRTMLEAANYDWDFIGSNYLSSNDSDFQTMLAAIVAQGILTQAELDELLPKCIWEQTPMA